MNVVTREFLKKHHACYYNEEGGKEKVNALVPPEGLSPLQVARLEIPDADRIWVFTRKGVLPDALLWEWAARTVERALGRIKQPDPRSLAVVPLLRRLASGEKVAKEEIQKIRTAAAAAYAAYGAYAAYAAAYAAAAAAYAAAADAAYAAAAYAAAREKERQQQIADITELLEKGL